MKRFTIPLASALLACALPAQAQSTVTVYGRMNLSVESQKTAAGRLSVLQNNSSRWGLKGSEELGGGLKAGFQLESGVGADNGSAGDPYWGRQAELYLAGDFGSLRLGNFTSEAYYATADFISAHNHDTGKSADALYAYLGRNSNKLAYRLPSLAQGLSLEVATSLKEGAASASSEAALNWALGDLQIGAGFEKHGDARQFALRGLYSLGAVSLGAYWQRDQDAWATAGRRNNLRLMAMFTAGANEFHLNLGQAGKVGGLSQTDARQLTLGWNHNLSKRSKVYAFYTRRDDGAVGLYGGDFRSLALGLRHNF